MLSITVAQSRRLDTGPQTFDDRSPATQKSQKRYVAEEVVVYLTPDQIKAIQEGKGFIDSNPADAAEISVENQEESEQSEEDESSQIEPAELNSQTLEEEEDEVATNPDEEANSEEIGDDAQLSWLNRYLNSYLETERQSEEVQAESEENEEEAVEEAVEEPQEDQPETTQQQRFKLIPFEATSEKSTPSTTKTLPNEPIRERLLRLLEQNHIILKSALSEEDQAAKNTTTIASTEQSRVKPETTLAKLRYSAKYRVQNKSNTNKDQRKKNSSGKQKIVISEVRARNVSNIVRKANRQQKWSIKAEPLDLKASRPYTAPLKVLKSVTAQAVKTGNKDVEAKQSAAPARAVGIKPKASSPKKSSANVADTYVVESRTPTETERQGAPEIQSRQKGKPERLTIIRHVFEN
ncbi:unnamed protein product, partial [Iphiclides podalirius]